MKSIGLDLGSVTCGVAISDELGMIARTYDTIRFEADDYNQALTKVIEICQKEHVTNIVLGNPKHMNGDEGIRSQISYKFKEELEKRANLTVTLLDERLTTVVAERSMLSADFSRKKRRQKKDEVAAVTILQDYLDSKGGFCF